MPLEPSLLVELAIIVVLALGFGLLAWRLHIPTELGQLVAGMIIGPFGFKLVSDTTAIEGIAEIGIVLLLFIVGLELNPFELKKMGVAVFVFSLVEITVSFGAGLLAGFALGWSVSESVILGGVISISSTAIIVSMLYRRRALTQSLGRMMCGALIVEDMFAILILSLMPSLAQGNLFSIGNLALLVVKLAFLVVFVFAFATYLAPRLIDKISHLEFDVDESGFLLSLGLGFAMAALAYGLGLSAGIGAFLLGLFIVGKRARFVYERVHPLRVLFIIIFFVTMGMLVDPSQFLNPVIVLPTVGLAVTGKYVGSYLGAVLSGHRELAGDIAIEMNPRGEFSFILARGASSAGVVRGLIYPIAGTLVLATTLVSVFVRFIQEKYRQVAKQAD